VELEPNVVQRIDHRIANEVTIPLVDCGHTSFEPANVAGVPRHQLRNLADQLDEPLDRRNYALLDSGMPPVCCQSVTSLMKWLLMGSNRACHRGISSRCKRSE